MSKITNKAGLPAALVEAVTNDPYHAGGADITASQLGNPPQLVALAKAHADDIVEDASDRIWSLLGQSVHVILERASTRGELAEDRLSCEVEGWTVSGQCDNLDLRSGVLTDYKVTSVWSVVFGDRVHEWEAQADTYAYLLRKHGHTVNALQVVAILRDWQRSKADRDDYPSLMVQRVPLTLWTQDEALDWITKRVRLHQQAQHSLAHDMPLPACTPEEQWAKPTTFAVKKKKRVSAVRVLPSRDDAWAYCRDKGLAENGGDSLKAGYSIVERPGEQVRCNGGYCAAANLGVCEQWNREQEASGKEA